MIDDGAQVHAARIVLLRQAIAGVAVGDDVLVERVQALRADGRVQRAVADRRVRVLALVAHRRQKERIGQRFAHVLPDLRPLRLVLAGKQLRVQRRKRADPVGLLLLFLRFPVFGLHAHHAAQIVKKRSHDRHLAFCFRHTGILLYHRMHSQATRLAQNAVLSL